MRKRVYLILITGHPGIHEENHQSNRGEFEADPCLGSKKDSNIVVASARVHPLYLQRLLSQGLQNNYKCVGDLSQQLVADTSGQAQQGDRAFDFRGH